MGRFAGRYAEGRHDAGHNRTLIPEDGAHSGRIEEHGRYPESRAPGSEPASAGPAGDDGRLVPRSFSEGGPDHHRRLHEGGAADGQGISRREGPELEEVDQAVDRRRYRTANTSGGDRRGV